MGSLKDAELQETRKKLEAALASLEKMSFSFEESTSTTAGSCDKLHDAAAGSASASSDGATARVRSKSAKGRRRRTSASAARRFKNPFYTFKLASSSTRASSGSAARRRRTPDRNATNDGASDSLPE